MVYIQFIETRRVTEVKHKQVGVWESTHKLITELVDKAQQDSEAKISKAALVDKLVRKEAKRVLNGR